MSIEIRCPSGLTGKIRGLTGKDGRFLSDAALQKSGMMVDHILANCWEETLDPGFYQLDSKGNLPWGKVLIGDRMYVLIQIRIAGRGESTYDFKHQCENPQCRESFDWEIDLEELPVQMLSEQVRARFAAGHFELECVVPGTEERRLLTEDGKGLALLKPKREIVPGTGKKATFRLQTGADEAVLMKLAQGKRKNKKPSGATEEENALTDMVRLRTLAIEGAPDLNSFFDDMPLDSIARMLDRYDEQDCGVDTTIEIQCPACERLQEKNLPFGGDFFFQRKKVLR